VATWADVRAVAGELPGAVERDRQWRVRNTLFAWERPLRAKDLAELGDAAPAGPVLGLRVADLAAKDAVLADPEAAAFTTSHFAGYPAVLVRLDDVAPETLRELVVEAWAARAPKRAVAAYFADRA
jgi:hypothetical protein